MIKCERISLSFPNQLICKNLSFTINKGESICFSGPSGKGKSSLLKVLMGFLSPQSGRIAIDGVELNSATIDLIRHKMTWLPQNSNLPVDSANELVELLQLNTEQMTNFQHFLDLLAVADSAGDKSFMEISGGQKQRVVMAACLSLDKPILLLDEPVSALDDHSIDLLFSTLNSLHNKTIVSTSHNQKWIKYCNQKIEL
ncbi:ATP-binding cassette domain-containing protein [Labilibaculum sp.]|uniref:ABC transporter ATP-binding protein n=1 Tax=Labilibaculum sp. TaxID=2060723 RepID=UPI00356A141F